LKIDDLGRIVVFNGRLNDYASMPHMKFLPPVLQDVAVNDINNFSRNSVSYNPILSLGATGVENHTPDHPGWERIHGVEFICILL